MGYRDVDELANAEVLLYVTRFIGLLTASYLRRLEPLYDFAEKPGLKASLYV